MRRDPAEFDAFVRDVSPRLLRLAWLLTGSPHTAEDLVQGALERLYVAWPRLDGGDTVNYARRTLVNLHTDWVRRRREVVTAAVPESSRPESLRPDPADGVALADHLTRALATLPARERQCVVLRHHADLSEAQVADLLGIGVGTVKSSTSRRLARLREVLVTEGDRHA